MPHIITDIIFYWDIQIKYGLSYFATCPSMSTDLRSLNPGMRRSRVPGWWDSGFRTNTGTSDTNKVKWQNKLNPDYSTGSWKLFSYPFTGVLYQRDVVSPVIRSPAYNAVQIPILLHSVTQSDMKVMKIEFNKLYWGFRLDSPLTTLVINTLLLVRTAFCVFRLSDGWMVPIGTKHHGTYVCLLFDYEVDAHPNLHGGQTDVS